MISESKKTYYCLTSMCKRAVECLNRDNMSLVSELWRNYNATFEELVLYLKEKEWPEAEELTYVLRKVAAQINNRSNCTLIIEDELLPLLVRLFSNTWEVIDINNDYSLVGTKSGFYSLKDNSLGKPINSLSDPLWEGYQKADELYDPTMTRFYILGVELGYLAYAVWKKSYEAVNVVVLDTEENVRLACEYGLLTDIEESSVTILCSDDINELFAEFTKIDEFVEQTGYYISENIIHRASDCRDAMIAFRANQNAVNAYTTRYAVNYWKNKSGSSLDVDSLIDSVKQGYEVGEKSEFVIVGAGPSINDNVDFLRESVGKRVIIAVSTALKKLKNLDIKPDYITIVDPFPELMEHINGLEEFTKGIPLVAESVSNWKFVEQYNGPKYRVLANDYKEVIDEAERNNIEVWGYGRTVSVFAMELAAHMGAEVMYFVGTDYAYPGKKAYADSTSEDARCELEVLSVDGSMVGSTFIFKTFIDDTEKMIERYEGKIKFINMSRHGAYIKGAFCNKWWENGLDETNGPDVLRRIAGDATIDWNEKYYLLWQMISRELCFERGAPEAFWTETGATFDVIKNEFLGLVSLKSKEAAQATNGFVVLMTSDFRLGEEALSEQVLADATKIRHNAGKDVLIVNTCEFMGGRRVPLKNSIPKPVNELMAEKNEVVYLGERYPYFQMPMDMPNAQITEGFIEMLAQKTPELIISYDPFSLVAAACKTIFNVEHR